MNALDKNFDYFLKNDFSDVKEGEWIAIYNNNVISHGLNLKKVIFEAKKMAPISKVLLSKIKKTASYL